MERCRSGHNGTVSKTDCEGDLTRGFESHSLRQNYYFRKGCFMKKFFNEKLGRIIVLVIIVVAFGASLAVMLKYKTEGEKNMPFKLSKLLVISSAEAENKDENPDNQKWNLEINQYNDVYISFNKNQNYNKNSYIESITLENIRITQPKVGEILLYRQCEDENKMFSYDEKYLIKDNIVFKGALDDNAKELKIGNNGGTITFRVLNKSIGDYVSDDDDEIHYDGTLLKKSETALEDLNAKISFDVVIKTNKSSYRGEMEIVVPNKNIDEEGVVQSSIENFNNIIFKRERSK